MTSIPRDSLAETIQSRLKETRGGIELSKQEAEQTALNLKQGSITEEEVAKLSSEVKKFKYYGRLGDYSGRLVDLARCAAIRKNYKVSAKVGVLAERLRDSSTASSVRDALEAGIKGPPFANYNIDIRTVEVAIFHWYDGNLACHSRHRSVAGNLTEVRKVIDDDLMDLPEILPKEHLTQLEEWEKIIRFYEEGRGSIPTKELEEQARDHETATLGISRGGTARIRIGHELESAKARGGRTRRGSKVAKGSSDNPIEYRGGR